VTNSAFVASSESTTVSTCPMQKRGVAQVFHLCPRPSVPYGFTCLVIYCVLAYKWIFAMPFMPPSTTLLGIKKGGEDARHTPLPVLLRLH